MRGQNHIKLDQGIALVIAAVIALAGTLIVGFKDDLFKLLGTSCLGNSEPSNPSDESGSNSGSESDSDSQPSFYNENGMVELFDDHSGVAYIYKKYLDENPLDLVDENGNYKIVGWYIRLTCDDKEFSFNIDSTTTPGNLCCYAQYDLNGKYQSTYSNQTNVFYDENGNLKIEFNFNTIPFDLRDSSNYIKIDTIVSNLDKQQVI